MGFEEEYAAIRRATAWTMSTHMGCCRISGDGSYDVLDRVCPTELYLRDGQVLHTVLLDENAAILADLYVCRDDEDFLLLSEAAPGVDVAGVISGALIDGDEAEVRDLGATHDILSLNGPYAWETLAELLGPDVISQPYMSFFATDGMTCVRAGKTGEFGYDLIIPKTGTGEWVDRLGQLAERLDVREAGLPVLDQCALENWFFNIRREGRHDITPLELQLQWRISARRTFVGSEALAARRATGPKYRIVTALADQPLAVDAAVDHDGRTIGSIVNAGRSPLGGDWVALALLETSLSHPGIERFTASDGGDPVVMRTTSPPVLNNRSIFVNPQIHSYATRAEFEFPPLAKEWA